MTETEHKYRTSIKSYIQPIPNYPRKMNEQTIAWHTKHNKISRIIIVIGNWYITKTVIENSIRSEYIELAMRLFRFPQNGRYNIDLAYLLFHLLHSIWTLLSTIRIVWTMVEAFEKHTKTKLYIFCSPCNKICGQFACPIDETSFIVHHPSKYTNVQLCNYADKFCASVDLLPNGFCTLKRCTILAGKIKLKQTIAYNSGEIYKWPYLREYAKIF